MMKKIDFRCPPELLTEIERRATEEGISPGQWCRRACEEKLGMSIEVKKGLGGANERTRKRVERLRLKGGKQRGKSE